MIAYNKIELESRLRNNCVNIWKNQGITGLNHQDIAIV